MSDKKKVRIELVTVQDGEQAVLAYQGELFVKARSLFVRYTEQEEDVRCLVRISAGELSVVRRGAVDSEQLFVPGKTCRGNYKSPYIQFDLETHTTALFVSEGELGAHNGMEQYHSDYAITVPDTLPFTVYWEYALVTNGQLTGQFQNKLYIREDV